MTFIHFFIDSFSIFIISFWIGTFIDNQFSKLSVKTNKILTLFLCFLHLSCIITVSYFLKTWYTNTTPLENYNPHILFSTFLFSLQSSLINNLRTLIVL